MAKSFSLACALLSSHGKSETEMDEVSRALERARTRLSVPAQTGTEPILRAADVGGRLQLDV